MIREATSFDKIHVIKFCIDTFSWGDYIKDVWDFWLSEGLLFVTEINNPVGLCHAVFLKNQVWLEGVRVDSNFRRRGIASKMIKKIESIAKNQKIDSSLMLIDIENNASLLMAKNLNYKIYQTWNFYSLSPKPKINYKITFNNKVDQKKFSHYVKSWRWIPLDQKKIDYLNSKKCIVSSGYGETKTVAILEDSEHFRNTLIVTLYAGTQDNTISLLNFLQNYGFEKNYQRLQILTREILPKFEELDIRISFHLMQKLLY